MPQIPVYNKGQGTTVDLATGSLSPQASVQAFTAPGRATENFANNAQQIAFNFGQAEKKAQGDAASSDIQSKFLEEANNKILTSQTTDTETAKNEINGLVNKYTNKIAVDHPNLTRSQIRGITNNLKELGVRAGTQHRKQSFARGRIVESKKNDDLILNFRNSIKTYSKGHPVYEAHLGSVKKIYEQAELNGSNKGLTHPTFKSFEKAVLSDEVFLKVNTGDITGAENLVKSSTIIDDEQKFKLLRTLRSEATVKQNDLYNQTIENIDQEDFTTNDVKLITDKLELNQPFSHQLSSGKTVSFSPESIGTGNKLKLINFLNKKAKQTVEKDANLATALINNAPFTDTKTFSSIASESYADLEDGIAQKSISSSANFSASRAEQLVEIFKVDPSAVDINAITENINKARYLLTTNIKGNALVNTVDFGKSSSALLEKINKTEIDLRKAALENQKLNTGFDSIIVGNFEFVKDNYTSTEIEKMTDSVLKNKPIDEQLALIQANGLVSNQIKTVLANGVEEGTGTSFDQFITSVSEKEELYKNLKLTGQGLINHTTQAERSFYEAILLNESLGFDREDAIRRVGLANQTNISPTDVDIKYQAIENASQKIKNGLDGVFGTDVFNLSAMRIKAEKYTKFLLRFGTNKDIAIKTAVEDLKNSHVLINNHLITKFANLPSNFEEKTNILAEKLKEENPELKDAEGIAFIPMDGRVDKFHVYVDGEPQFGSGYIISKEDFDNALNLKAEKKKIEQQTKVASRNKLTKILEENLENLKGAQETAFGFAGD